MSSLNSLNLACAGELALSTMAKLHQKQSVVPLSVEKLNISSRAESLQYRWAPGPQGQGQEEDGAARKMSSYIF